MLRFNCFADRPVGVRAHPKIIMFEKLVYVDRTLEDQMREFDIVDLRPFYLSSQFQQAHFQLDQGAGLITLRRA